MLRETSLLWWQLGILTKRRFDALRERFGDLDTATAHLDASLLEELRVRSEILPDALRRLAEFDAAEVEDQLWQANAQLLSIDDEHYPSLLREIPDPPIFLSLRGDGTLLNGPALALVGTRRMMGYGRQVTEAFVPPFVRAGVVTVSGLAAGIDTRVAEETMHHDGHTIAVLGHGLHMMSSPEKQQLADRIVQSGGLILSEFPLDFPANIYTYPARNRVIAGVSMGTVVLEAPLGSGAIITADLALEYNRDVFAVPGSIFDDHFAGCHRLLAQGHARLVTSAEEVLRELGVIAAPGMQAASYAPTTAHEAVIYALLSAFPKQVDEIVQESLFPASVVAGTLTMLELAGAARGVEGNKWVRC